MLKKLITLILQVFQPKNNRKTADVIAENSPELAKHFKKTNAEYLKNKRLSLKNNRKRTRGRSFHFVKKTGNKLFS